MAYRSVSLVCYFVTFIDKLNNDFNSNVPAVASKVRFDDSANVGSFPAPVTNIFSNFMFGTSNIAHSDYCMEPPISPAPGLFTTRSLLLWCRPTGTVPYRPRACRSWSYLFVSTLLLLSGDIETNPGPARLVNFNLGCLNVRSMRNKAAANHDVIVDYRLDFLVSV